jgi:hypothetical protein
VFTKFIVLFSLAVAKICAFLKHISLCDIFGRLNTILFFLIPLHFWDQNFHLSKISHKSIQNRINVLNCQYKMLHTLESHLDDHPFDLRMQPIRQLSVSNLAQLGSAPSSWYQKTRGGIFWT